MLPEYKEVLGRMFAACEHERDRAEAKLAALRLLLGNDAASYGKAPGQAKQNPHANYLAAVAKAATDQEAAEIVLRHAAIPIRARRVMADFEAAGRRVPPTDVATKILSRIAKRVSLGLYRAR